MFGSVFEFATGGKLFNASCFTSGIELLFGSGLELAIRGDFFQKSGSGVDFMFGSDVEFAI